MRRFVSCTLASLIGAGVLMIAPASSLAGGGFVPCTSSLCPSSTQLMVEVRPVAEGTPGIVMDAPVLPRRASNFDYQLESHYFQRLLDIEEGICEMAEAWQKEGGTTAPVTGFIAQVASFNAIRQPLTKLLRYYRLGWAPTLTDFSDIRGFSIVLNHQTRKLKDGIEEGPLEENGSTASSCTFTLV